MRYALIYGLLSGSVIAAIISAAMFIGGLDGFGGSIWFGFAVMLVALSFIFVGVKRYRDVERGGVIKFLPALGIGVGIAAVAGVAYVAAWEIYLAATGYAFMEQYIAIIVPQRQAAGVPAADIAAEVAWMRAVYADPLKRVAITFSEMLPVSLLVALVSAALLRNPRLLPPTVRTL